MTAPVSQIAFENDMSQGPANFHQPNIADQINPYAPTATSGFVTPELSDAETLRKTHLNHEASIKAIGTLYLLGAILLVPMGLLIIVGALFAEQQGPDVAMIVVGLIYLAIGLVEGYAGLGLRRLTNAGRNLGIIFAAIGLIGFPIGTLISAYILYLLLSQKGKVVFSDHYRQVIAQTPHIKYKTSIVVWILLGLVVALVALAILAAMTV
jgi:hypothetical protein